MNEKQIQQSARNETWTVRKGMLTVIERLPGSKYVCLCDCGNTRTVLVGHFNTGKIKSCGCHVVRHGHGRSGKRSREYITYHNMIARCTKPTNKRYSDYGARGIYVCERWNNSFNNFLEDMGPCPDGMQIDRIDNNAGYTPENCRWATRKANMANRSVSKRYVIDGVEYTSSIEAANKFNVSKCTILAWCNGRTAAGRYYPPKSNCSVIEVYS